MKLRFIQLDLVSQSVISAQTIECDDVLKGLVDFYKINDEEREEFLDYIIKSKSMKEDEFGWVFGGEEVITVVSKL